ncbi:glycosyltransferase family 4 protein [Methylomonas sp. TEB]|uniref:glycosyltransferase family 4 protein n=1 Tax=Methylomonas sp. TEB TaxID=3398229 RepID=UPI0039F5886A
MNILIFQPMLKQYRMPLFVKMSELLKECGHELRVVSGSPPKYEISKADNICESNGFCIVEKSHWVFNERLHYLHSNFSHILWADFVITEQANKHIHNYILIILRWGGFKKFAYWGHGQNRQGNTSSFRELIKRRLSTHCDWWFAYTKGVADYVAGLGYDPAKITILNNSVDTSNFRKVLAEQSSDRVMQFKNELGISVNSRVGLYCGSLYAEKKIEFLLNSALLIRELNPNFVLIIVGDGADRAIVKEYSDNYSFIKYLGPLFAEQKALSFRIAELFLCPGLVGLAILDAFTAGLPLFTCDIPNHSPEIEYLDQNVNGIMTGANERDYAQAVDDVLRDDDTLNKLRTNALDSSMKFTIENMAANFVDGIKAFIAN